MTEHTCCHPRMSGALAILLFATKNLRLPLKDKGHHLPSVNFNAFQGWFLFPSSTDPPGRKNPKALRPLINITFLGMSLLARSVEYLYLKSRPLEWVSFHPKKHNVSDGILSIPVKEIYSDRGQVQYPSDYPSCQHTP